MYRADVFQGVRREGIPSLGQASEKIKERERKRTSVRNSVSTFIKGEKKAGTKKKLFRRGL